MGIIKYVYVYVFACVCMCVNAYLHSIITEWSGLEEEVCQGTVDTGVVTRRIYRSVKK